MATSIHPLSYNQRLIWHMQRLIPGTSLYCEAIAWRILSELDMHALQRTCQWLVDRHTSLRTTYGIRDGQPVQWVHESQKAPLHIHECSDWDDREFQAEFDREVERPFTLETGPIVRAHLFLRSPGNHWLLLSVHHIATDLYSQVLIAQDFRLLYPMAQRGDQPPPPPKGEYTDFVHWQKELIQSSEGNRQGQYWQEQTRRKFEPLEITAACRRRAKISGDGEAFPFRLTSDLTSRLKGLAPSFGATMNAVLMGGFQALLHRWSGRKQFNIRTMVSGRSEPDFARVVGLFTNMVFIHADFTTNPTFAEIVARARDSVMAAIDNQDFPLLLLLERLHSAGLAPVHPFSDVMFRFQIPHRFRTEIREQKLTEEFGSSPSAGGMRMDFGGLNAEVSVPVKKTAYNSLDLELVEAGGEIFGAIHYRTAAFRKETIARMAEGYERLLASAVADPERRLSELAFLPEESDHAVLAMPEDSGLIRASGDRVPRTSTEDRLVRLWRRLFVSEPSSVHEDFFALGGDSLLAVQLSIMISSEFGVELPAGFLPEFLTVAEQASYIDKTKPQCRDMDDATI